MDKRTSGRTADLWVPIAMICFVASLGNLAAPKVCIWIFGTPINDAPELKRLAATFIAGLGPFIILIMIGVIFRFIIPPVLAWCLTRKKSKDNWR